MTLEAYSQILIDCHVDDINTITPATVEQSYQLKDMKSYDNKDFLCTVIPTQDGSAIVDILWVHPDMRKQGIATQLLKNIRMPHAMVVDYRSTDMHSLLNRLNYSKSSTYSLDGIVHQLTGGDLYYWKE